MANRGFLKGWLTSLGIILALGLIGLGVIGCSGKPTTQKSFDLPIEMPTPFKAARFETVAAPQIVTDLAPWLERLEPQVKILNPRPDEVIQNTTLTLKFQVKDLSIYKDEHWQLGPHLHLILDNQPYRTVYTVDEPLVLEGLTPGTHTLKMFAAKPWFESFKNEGAYDQVTFHVFTKTFENTIDQSQPSLTYNSPTGVYRAEPVMVDFFLTNAPLHMIAQETTALDITDWRIRLTVNGESQIFDTWQPIYIKGLEPGQNWVQLELIDDLEQPIQNPFNNTARLITYEPDSTDTLAKLVRGDLTVTDVRSIVDPSYVPPAPPPNVIEPLPIAPSEQPIESPVAEPIKSPAESPALETSQGKSPFPREARSEPEQPSIREPKASGSRALQSNSPEPEASGEFQTPPEVPKASKNETTQPATLPVKPTPEKTPSFRESPFRRWRQRTPSESPPSSPDQSEESPQPIILPPTSVPLAEPEEQPPEAQSLEALDSEFQGKTPASESQDLEENIDIPEALDSIPAPIPAVVPVPVLEPETNSPGTAVKLFFQRFSWPSTGNQSTQGSKPDASGLDLDVDANQSSSEQPTSDESEQPASAQSQQPTSDESEQPASAQSQQPTSGESEQPASAHFEQPASNESDEQPATSSPLSTGDNELTHSNAAREVEPQAAAEPMADEPFLDPTSEEPNPTPTPRSGRDWLQRFQQYRRSPVSQKDPNETLPGTPADVLSDPYGKD